jgi:DNA-binding IclR family transcriptional regulator
MTRASTKSPQRSVSVLQQIALSSDGRTLSELARSLGAPKTSLLSVLRSLRETGYVCQRGQVYELGAESHALAHQIVARQSLPRIARPILEALTAETGETAIVTALTDSKTEIVHLDKVESKIALRFAATVGDRRPLYCTAGGLVLLSHQPGDAIDRYIKSVVLRPMASNTISSKAALRRRVRSVAQAGLCVSINQSSEGVTGIAAPIYDHSGTAVASIVLAAPSLRVELQANELCRKARNFGLQISRLLGYLPAEKPGREPSPTPS